MNELDQQEYLREVFRDIVFADANISGKEFSECRFVKCDFTEADISRCLFDDCVFEGCNLSNPKISHAKLMDVEFRQCKLVGLRFYQCDQAVFDLVFEECRMMNCNFSDLKMKRSKFLSCEVVGCYFQNTFLVEADFTGSVFRETLFSACDLKKASFFDAHGYSIDPRSNQIEKAIFSTPDVLSLIECFNIIIKDK